MAGIQIDAIQFLVRRKYPHSDQFKSAARLPRKTGDHTDICRRPQENNRRSKPVNVPSNLE